MKKVLTWKIVAILLIAFFVAGWYSEKWYNPVVGQRISLVRENNNEYSYINPLLLVGGVQESPEFSNLKKSIDDYVTENIKNNKANSISVYFQDMNSGRWTGVNPDLLYNPASMLKVAVMVGYLKKASTDPKILTKKLEYIRKDIYDQHYPPEHPISTGTYTVRELIEAMIVDSDNDALESLYDNDRPAYIDVFKALNIPPPANITVTDFMSPRVYSRIFRTLYSSTYLPRSISEQTLQLLSYTSFKKGLLANIPESTISSHKFGEYTNVDALGNVIYVELHDCGIIYFPTKPYFLCVMTKGKDFNNLEKIIADISKTVYDYSKINS